MTETDATPSFDDYIVIPRRLALKLHGETEAVEKELCGYLFPEGMELTVNHPITLQGEPSLKMGDRMVVSKHDAEMLTRNNLDQQHAEEVDRIHGSFRHVALSTILFDTRQLDAIVAKYPNLAHGQ